MEFQVFEPSYDFIDARLNEFLGSRLSSVIAEVEGPLRIALVLYVVLYGFAILRGAISEPMMDFAIRSIKLLTAVIGDSLLEGLQKVRRDKAEPAMMAKLAEAHESLR